MKKTSIERVQSARIIAIKLWLAGQITKQQYRRRMVAVGLLERVLKQEAS